MAIPIIFRYPNILNEIILILKSQWFMFLEHKQFSSKHQIKIEREKEIYKKKLKLNKTTLHKFDYGTRPGF